MCTSVHFCTAVSPASRDYVNAGSQRQPAAPQTTWRRRLVAATLTPVACCWVALQRVIEQRPVHLTSPGCLHLHAASRFLAFGRRQPSHGSAGEQGSTTCFPRARQRRHDDYAQVAIGNPSEAVTTFLHWLPTTRLHLVWFDMDL